MGSSRDGLIFLHREQEDFLWLWELNNGINLGLGTRNGILANISLQGLVYDGTGSSTEPQKGEVPHALGLHLQPREAQEHRELQGACSLNTGLEHRKAQN